MGLRISTSLRIGAQVVNGTKCGVYSNPFGHRSTQSAFLGQIDQNAPGQPWVDQKSKMIKIFTMALVLTCFDTQIRIKVSGATESQSRVKLGQS